jgi:hypothetical protein
MATAAPHQVERFNVVNQTRPPEKKTQTFESRLIDTVADYYNLTRLSRPRRYYLWLMAALFAKGIHYVFYDPYRGSVEEWPQKKVSQCMYTPYPLIQYAVNVIASQYTTSNGQAIPMSEASEDPKIKAVLRSLKDYSDYKDWEFFRRDPQVRQTEAMMIPLRGCYSFVYWDKNAGPKMQVPRYGPQQQMVCADCGSEVANEGMDGTSGDPGVLPGAGNVLGMGPTDGATGPLPTPEVPREGGCPHCGSQNIQAIAAGVELSGMLPARQGVSRREPVDPFQVEIFDRRRGVEASKHLTYDEILFKTEAMKDYPWLKDVKGTATMGNYQQGFLGLHYLAQLQILLSNTGQLDQSRPDWVGSLGPNANTLGYYGSYLHQLLCWRRRAWLDVEVYSGPDWIADKDTQLPGRNDLIPKGTKWAEVFPDGMLIHLVNGDTVVQVENQDKNKHWSYVAYRPSAEGLHGAGVTNLLSLNRGYDEASSFQMQALLDAALGRVLFDERITKFTNIPGKGTPVSIDARPLGEPMQNLMARVDVGGAQAIGAAEPVKESLRGQIGDLTMAANPQGAGLRPQGVGKETATAARYNAGATSTLQAPPMELYAAHRAKSIEQAVELEKKHGFKPRGYTKHDETTVRWFDPLQIPEDVRWAVVNDSWQPRTMETKRENIGAAVSLGVGTGNLSPAMEEQASRVFGLDEETDTYEDWAVKAEKRLDALKEMAPAVMQEAQQAALEVQNPEEAMMLEQALPQRLIQLAQAAPQPMDQPGHGAYARYYGELYLKDDWDAYLPVLQQAITQLWQMHNMAVQQEQMQQAMQEAGVDPEAEASAREDEEVSKETDRQRGEEAESKSHKRQMKSEDTKHKHKIEQDKLKHKNALELERVRGKNRPKPGAKKK